MSIYFWHVTSYYIQGEVPGMSRLVPKIMGMGNENARVYIHCIYIYIYIYIYILTRSQSEALEIIL